MREIPLGAGPAIGRRHCDLPIRMASQPRFLAGVTPLVTGTLDAFLPGEIWGYIETVLRLSVLALLAILALGLARVMVEFRVEQRRRRRLADARDIHELTPSDFESYVAILFEKAGYAVRRTGGSGDHGVDLLLSRDGKRHVVQCKRYEDTIGPSTIREMVGAMTNARIERGFLVTTSRFSRGAEAEARESPYHIDLIDGPRLVRWARRYGLPAEVAEPQPRAGGSSSEEAS